MGFNYLQTDDRDDYLSQFDSRGKKKYVRYSVFINGTWKFWLTRYFLKKTVKRLYNYTAKNVKRLTEKEMIILLENKGYLVQKAKFLFI